MQKYNGGCQCGAVRFEVTVDATKGLACNCSRCGKLGSVLAFVPASQFALLSGEDAQTEYLFNKKTITHLFCKTCGIQSFAKAAGPDGALMVAVNLRCVDGVEMKDVVVTEYNGKDI